MQRRHWQKRRNGRAKIESAKIAKIAKITKIAKIESAKNEAEKQKQEKLKKDQERLKREEEERQHHLEEELKWAEEARLQEKLGEKRNILELSSGGSKCCSCCHVLSFYKEHTREGQP